MSGYYVLEGDQPVRVDGLHRWASWFFRADREVARTTLADGACITTEFVGVDHREAETRAAPLLFETRTFAPGHAAQVGRRYASWLEARAGHKDAVRRHIRRLS